jgi:DNA polymerase-4
MTLRPPIDSTSDIYRAAATLLAVTVKRGACVRLLGVRATNLIGGRQLSLFDSGSEKRARLDKAVDDIRERFGDKAIRRASLADKARKQQRRRQPPHAG